MSSISNWTGKTVKLWQVVNRDNSTQAPLLAAGTFVGEWAQVDDFPAVTVSCLTDQAGTLFIDFAAEAGTVLKTYTVAVTGGVYSTQTYKATNRYVRVRMTNGGTPQTALSIQTIFGHHSIVPSDAATLTEQQNQSTKLDAIVTAIGAISAPPGKESVALARHVYSITPVTTSAYTELVSALPDDVTELFIFDSSGRTLFLATGAAASEVDQAYIVPGGNGILRLAIASGERVSIKAIGSTANSGELNVTFLK